MKRTKTPSARAVTAMLSAGALLAFAGTAQAALQDRDLDGDSVFDAFYDTELDITWLRNADGNGAMDWDTAVAWADGFSVAGYDDWRLPIGDTCWGYNGTGRETGHTVYMARVKRACAPEAAPKKASLARAPRTDPRPKKTAP